MLHYYILDLRDIKRPEPNPEADGNLPFPIVSSEIIDYVINKGFSCFNDIYLEELSIDLDLPFQTVLRDVFVTFIDMEHRVARQVCGKKLRVKTNPFIEDYISLVSECNDTMKKIKCESLEILHDEDELFLYSRLNYFFNSTKYYSYK